MVVVDPPCYKGRPLCPDEPFLALPEGVPMTTPIRESVYGFEVRPDRECRRASCAGRCSGILLFIIEVRTSPAISHPIYEALCGFGSLENSRVPIPKRLNLLVSNWLSKDAERVESDPAHPSLFSPSTLVAQIQAAQGPTQAAERLPRGRRPPRETPRPTTACPTGPHERDGDRPSFFGDG